MASSPPAPSSQPGTRVFGDVVGQVLRFVQQPSSNSRTFKSGPTRDLNTDFNHDFSTGSSSSNNAHYPTTPIRSAERSPAWSGHEHEASPLSPSRTLVASASSDSSSSTPRSRYRSLKRTESSGSTNSSTSRSTETQNGGAEGRKGKGSEKANTGKRLNVSDRLRRLGKRMQVHKSSLSSPKVSADELADGSDGDHRIRPSSAAYTSGVSSRVYPTMEVKTNFRSLQKGKGKEKQSHTPGAHAKLLSMVVEADESGANTPSSLSSGHGSGATTPTIVQAPEKITAVKSMTPGSPNNDGRSRDDPPEPMTFAARIQALIAGLPFPSLPRPGTTIGNDLHPLESPPISTDSPTLHHSPELSAHSSPFHMSPPPLPSSPLPSSSHNYDVNVNVEMDTEGRPIPPPYASPLPPRERMILEEFLSSPVIMNGELPQEDVETDTQGAVPDQVRVNTPANRNPKPTEKVTRSIWSVLESMGTKMGSGQASSSPPLPTSSALPASSNTPTSPPVPQQPTRGVADARSTPNENESMFSDTGSSVMIYSPLIPSGAQDLPELAEVVSVVTGDPAFEVHEDRVGPSAAGTGTDPSTAETLSSWIPSAVRQWSFVQAFTTWSTTTPADSSANNPQEGKEGTASIAAPSSSTSTTGTTSSTATSGGAQLPSGPISTRPAVRKAWVPSTTKMSVQAMWWGYRLYMPPPVMAILSDRTLEASKRAALITSSLTWFFANLPITALPPPLQPAALLLQRIAPFLGYIGAFISWSWGVIEGYDVGYGVTLTATWLLPMALIPGTWHKDEFPTSPLALGQPVPLLQFLYSPAPAPDRALEPRMIQTPSGSAPARVTEFLPLPTLTSAESALTPHTPATPLPPFRAPSQSSTSPSPFSLIQLSPLMTPAPTPSTPVSPSRTPRPRRELEITPSTPQYMPTNIDSAMPSPTLTSPSNYQTPLLSSPAPTSSSHYQTPLLSSPAPTSSSQYQTPLLSPLVLPLSPLVPLSAHPLPLTTPTLNTGPISTSGRQTYASIYSPPHPALAPSLSLSSTPTPRPHSKSKLTSMDTSAPAAIVPTPTHVPPVPPSSVQATPRPPARKHKSKANDSSRSQGHPESRPPPYFSQTPPGVPRPTLTQTITTNTHTTAHGTATRTLTTPTISDTHTRIYPNAAPVPTPVPVGSQLEQHLLSGPLMSPIALPEVDLPDPAAVIILPSLPSPVPAQTAASAPVPIYAYSNKEERRRERDRDKARIRERARAIFRRTDSSGPAGAQKAKA